jgi:DivIVA domain-containing protein
MRGKRKEKRRLEKGNEAGLFDEHEPSEQPRRITPVDIQQKEFRLAMRGYHERDVDEFLDEITEEVARLYAENKRLQEELGSKGTARFATGSGAAEAEAALRQARDEAARILADAESRARMISAAAAAQGPGSTGVTPMVTGAALAGFLSREKSFLQNLAKMMQEHANAMKEDVRRVRETAAGGRAGSARTGAPSSGEASAIAPEPPGRRQPEAEHELWRPQQSSGPSPSPSSAPQDLEEPPPEAEWMGRDQPPYFMDERERSSDVGPGPAGAPTASIPASGESHEDRTPAVMDLMDVEQPSRVFSPDPDPSQAVGWEVESDPALESEAPPEAYVEAPPAADVDAPPPATSPSDEAPLAPNPYVDEPTREWTSGEGGVDADRAEELIVRGHVPPGTRGRRWSPRPEVEAPGDERSLKELFWGED